MSPTGAEHDYSAGGPGGGGGEYSQIADNLQRYGSIRDKTGNNLGRQGVSARATTMAFTGMPGALPFGYPGGDGNTLGWSATDPEDFLRENLSLKDLVSLAYMFNFSEAGVLDLGERKAVVQVRKP